MRNHDCLAGKTGGSSGIVPYIAGPRFAALFLSVILTFYLAGCSGAADIAGVQTAQTCSCSAGDSVGIKYLLFLPTQYHRNHQEHPMILFLHDSGQKGYDINKLRSYGLPKLIDNRGLPTLLTSVIVSPQCPAGANWSTNRMLGALDDLIDHVTSAYAIDSSRICVTGVGMGGTGTWALAEKFPHRFAAIAPVCGWGDTAKASILTDLPVWAFDAARDSLTSIPRSIEMIDTIRRNGGDASLKIFPGTREEIMKKVYGELGIYTWFGKQKTSYNRDPFVRRGLHIMALRDSVDRGRFAPSVESLEKDEMFGGYLDSPFIHSRFYLYWSGWMNPSTCWVMCSYGDTMVFAPPTAPNLFGYPGPDDSTVDFLNRRLAYEPEFDSRQVKRLARLYAALMAHGMPYKILDSWTDIEYDKGESPPLRLRKEIRPPYITRHGEGCYATVHVWFKYERGLYRILLYYDRGKIRVDTVLLGMYGRLYLLL